MGPRRSERFLVTVALAICLGLGGAATGLAQEKVLLGWYVGASLGMNRASGLAQAGWNRDDICYPTGDCAHVGGAPQGYRWSYDLDAGDGAAFEFSVGRAFDLLRLELSFTQRSNDLTQRFTGISYLDGSLSVRAEESNYESRSSPGIDDLTTRSLSLNAYYDFSKAARRFTPYVGVGAGLSFVRVSGLYFQSWYSCKDPAAADCDRPGRYNSHQDENLSDTLFSAHLHTGLDYHLNDNVLVGLKLSYAMLEDMEDIKGGYIHHPVPGISNFTTISGMNHWTALLGVKYFFGQKSLWP